MLTANNNNNIASKFNINLHVYMQFNYAGEYFVNASRELCKWSLNFIAKERSAHVLVNRPLWNIEKEIRVQTLKA